MSLDALKRALKNARYKGHINTLLLPDDFYSHLSLMPRAFIHQLLDYPQGISSHSVIAFLLDDWSEDLRASFWDLEPSEQLEVAGFLTALLHEHIHAVDFTTTPFGANYQGKLAREYLYFQRRWQVLIDAPQILGHPLVDWLNDAPFGPHEVEQAAKAGGLRLARVELRGPGLFDSLLQGHAAAPGHISPGWPGQGKPDFCLAGGKHYRKVTVDQVWMTIDPGIPGVSYLGPFEIVEGRALALCLLYIWHLTGRDCSSQQLLGKYVAEFYSDSPQYKAAFEVLTGRSLSEIGHMNPELFIDSLRATILATWYALHAPMPEVGEDVLMALTARFVLAARMFASNEWMTFSSGVDFLDAIDSHLSHQPSYVSAPQTYVKATHGIEGSLLEVHECSNEPIRGWFERTLTAQRSILATRCAAGYASPFGLPENGNVLTGLDDEIGGYVLDAMDAPPVVRKWFELRNTILFKRLPAAMKTAGLRDWFKGQP